ncbi:MAG: BglII/BstYI family type II restriction endonuclease [Patescibacteria group bacterium]
MKIVKTYSFKKGEEFLKKNHPRELQEILDAIEDLDATSCLTKESQEKTMKGRLLFSPSDLNNKLKTVYHKKGWTKAANAGKKKIYSEPRHAFGGGRFREMDGIKNKVGLEVQFGKYAFMGYDIFSKMVIFRNLKYIDCGVEIVAGQELVKQMSTGVSSFDQLLIDFEHRGEADIDCPVFVIGIGLTDEEKENAQKLTKLFKTDKEKALRTIGILKSYSGTLPGPKKEVSDL